MSYYKHFGRLRNVWNTMIQRCTNPNVINYPRYGGRGIKVCEYWRTFDNFYKDMGDAYAPGLTLDRIDNNGNYEPGNVRWATMKENQRNRRDNNLVTYGGVTQTLGGWADTSGIQRSTLWVRQYRLKWSVERMLTTPVRAQKEYLKDIRKETKGII